MTEQQHKLILCLDFDGVIHDYTKGWQGGKIYGNTTPGFWEWAEKARHIFRLVIYSSRSGTREGILAMIEWLADQAATAGVGRTAALDWFTFANEKPPAFITIDDRGVTFLGDWNALDPEKLLLFRTWYQQ